MARTGLALLTTAAFAAAAAGGFLAAQTATGSSLGPVDCSAGAKCIPDIHAEDVYRALEEQGFACNERYSCELAVGSSRYNMSLIWYEDENGLISSYTVDVRHDPRFEVSPRGAGLLAWFATMPFSNDPDADAAVRGWLEENLGGDDEVTVRDFDFELASPEPGHVQLVLRGFPIPDPIGD